MSAEPQYLQDLAYVHDQGFSRVAEQAGVGLIDLLGNKGRVVELGCGSGTLAKALLAAGYAVHGVDFSAAMVALTQANAPGGQFVVGSLWDYKLPPCEAVVSVGECLNYEFDQPNKAARLRKLFTRVFAALTPGGFFIFDILCASGGRGTVRTQRFTEGPDWFVAVERSEARTKLTRRIIAFRQVGKQYRKSIETHHVRKYNLVVVVEQLKRAGFQVQTRKGYTSEALGPNHVVLVARKG